MTPPAWAGSTRRKRLPSNWRTLRRLVLDRDGHRCQLDRSGCTRVATEVDHIRPGDDHRLANLQAACHSCHQFKSASEGGKAARHAPRPSAKRPPEQHPGVTA